VLRKSLSRLFGDRATTSGELDAFIAESDRLGGPGHPDCHAYWRGFTYIPSTAVDQKLDPYGKAYCDQQLALYEEVSGRAFDQSVNEYTGLDVAKHTAAANPYDHPDPAALAVHMTRLSKALRLSGTKRNGELLDMGAGWGLSSELAAYLGLRVTAVDINPLFIELIRARAARSGLPIEGVVSSFDAFEAQKAYDCVLFYECLHHALRPWDLLGKLAANLAVEGRIVLAGEPINEHWWKHWGLRLDPLSLYCIRKFGWFETGWSMAFVRDMFNRLGFITSVTEDSDKEIGPIVVARRASSYSAEELFQNFAFTTGVVDSGFVVFGENLSLEVTFPDEKTTLLLEVQNFRSGPIQGAVLSQGKAHPFVLEPGPGTIRLTRAKNDPSRLGFTIETEFWRPSEELGSADTRTLSFHIKSGAFS